MGLVKRVKKNTSERTKRDKKKKEDVITPGVGEGIASNQGPNVN